MRHHPILASSQSAYAALARLQAGGSAGALRIIQSIAAEHGQQSPECADCSAWQRVRDLCAMGLAASDVNDAHLVAAHVRDLENFIEATQRDTD